MTNVPVGFIRIAGGLRFGEGADVEAERLILPASSDGKRVSSLFGLVTIPESTFEGE